MGIRYAIVNKDTGEVEENCSICSIGSTNNPSAFDAIENSLDDQHKVIEITNQERQEIRQSMGRNESGRRAYLKKLDLTKVTKRLKDRSDKSNSAVVARERREQ